jgi:hypothetical protein
MGAIEDAQAQAAANAAVDAAAVTAGSVAEATTERVPVETVAATNALTKAESGKVMFLDSATEFVTTLPAPAAGLEFEFIVANAPESASFTIVTNGSANIIRGHILTADVNAVSDGDFEAAGGDTLTFVDAKAVIGDRAKFVSDGTYWYVQAACSVFDAITITTAS